MHSQLESLAHTVDGTSTGRRHMPLYSRSRNGTLWHNCLVEIHCDNQTIISAIKSQSICGPAIDLLQALFLVTTLDNIKIQATWLSSQDNWIADALSKIG